MKTKTKDRKRFPEPGRMVSMLCFVRGVGLVVLAAATLVACSGDSEIGPVPQDNGIVFGTDDAATRGTVTTAVRKIGVFGYSHTGSFGDNLAMRIPDYFLNQAVTDLPGDGTWTYSGVRKYWPQDGRNVSFFAYAPYIDVEDTFILYPAAMADTGAPTITYTVPTDIFGQIDLMYANRTDMTFATSNNGRVEFTMDHALTRVDFVVKLDIAEQNRPFIVEFNELTVRNVTGSGILDLSKLLTDADLWTTTRPADDSGWASYTMTSQGHGGLANLKFDARVITPDFGAGQTDAWDWNGLFKSGQYLMLIPQNLEGQSDGLTPAEISLKYTVTNVFSGEDIDVEEIIPLWRAMLPEWKPGMGVTYQLTLSLVEGTVIEFEIEAFIVPTPWDDVNSDNPSTGSVG
ncbi:MAG: fimbrillin family protein [Rikenellaceae bacterium]|nr:fimbrillin family protein [Rikenellaceae bacterium]